MSVAVDVNTEDVCDFVHELSKTHILSRYQPVLEKVEETPVVFKPEFEVSPQVALAYRCLQRLDCLAMLLTEDHDVLCLVKVDDYYVYVEFKIHSDYSSFYVSAERYRWFEHDLTNDYNYVDEFNYHRPIFCSQNLDNPDYLKKRLSGLRRILKKQTEIYDEEKVYEASY